MKILFVSHEASRTGAPIILLDIIRWLTIEKNIEAHTFLLHGGELESEFTAISKTFKWIGRRPHDNQNHLLSKLVTAANAATLLKLKLNNYDLIYVNSAASAYYITNLHRLIRAKTPILFHVHELEFVIQQSIGSGNFKSSCLLSNKIIGVSEAVCKHIKSYDNDLSPVMIHGFTGKIRSQPNTTKSLKAKYKLEDKFIVCGSGTLDWRKGIDLFILTLMYCQSSTNSPDIHFMWVGGDLCSPEAQAAKLVVTNMGLADDITFVGAVSNPQQFFEICNVFYLSSREDPFPLVCLEAASAQKPIICFEKAGGAPELVQKDAGIVVRYCDPHAAAEEIINLSLDHDKCRRMGICAQHRIKSTLCSNNACAKIYDVILTSIANV